MSTRDAKSRTKTRILNGALLVAVAGAGFGGYTVLHSSGAGASVTRTTSTVARGNVSQSVSASGNVAALASVDLNFDSGVSSNLVSEIDVKVGDKVKKGQVLAKVDDRVLQNNLAAAQASLVAAQANYNKTKAGLTPEERVQADSSDTQAAIQLANAQTAVDNAIATQAQNATTTAESVRQATNNLANVQAQADRDLATPQANYDTAKANYDGPKATRDTAAALVATLTADRDHCTANTGEATSPDGQSCTTVDADLAAAQTTLTAADNALKPFQTALDTASSALDAQKLKSKTSIDSATNSVINAQNNQTSGATKDAQSLLSAQRALESQQASYDSTIATNQLKRKAPTAADMAAQDVSLTNAKNSLFTAQKNATNATLVATADGTIGAMNGRVGYAGSNTSGTGTTTGSGASSNAFVTITDLSAYEVKVGFGEADAAKVKVGQTATISLDALSGARLTATVRTVDTVSTLVSNVVTYYAYLTITQTNGVAVQPGMTATASVVVDSRANVLFLPTSSVTSRGATSTVNLQTGKDPTKTESREVTIGLRGDTALEVTGGLNEGDVVVTVRQKVSTAQTTTNNGGGTLTGTNSNTNIPGLGAGGAGGVGGAGAGGAGAGAGRTRTGG